MLTSKLVCIPILYTTSLDVVQLCMGNHISKPQKILGVYSKTEVGAILLQVEMVLTSH